MLLTKTVMTKCQIIIRILAGSFLSYYLDQLIKVFVIYCPFLQFCFINFVDLRSCYFCLQLPRIRHSIIFKFGFDRAFCYLLSSVDVFMIDSFQDCLVCNFIDRFMNQSGLIRAYIQRFIRKEFSHLPLYFYCCLSYFLPIILVFVEYF